MPKELTIYQDEVIHITSEIFTKHYESYIKRYGSREINRRNLLLIKDYIDIRDNTNSDIIARNAIAVKFGLKPGHIYQIKREVLFRMCLFYTNAFNKRGKPSNRVQVRKATNPLILPKDEKYTEYILNPPKKEKTKFPEFLFKPEPVPVVVEPVVVTVEPVYEPIEEILSLPFEPAVWSQPETFNEPYNDKLTAFENGEYESHEEMDSRTFMDQVYKLYLSKYPEHNVQLKAYKLHIENYKIIEIADMMKLTSKEISGYLKTVGANMKTLQNLV